MINVGERIKKALFEQAWTQKRLCAEIDVTETGFKRMMDSNSWKLDTLEKVALALNKSVVYFIDDQEQKLDHEIKNTTKSNFGEDVINELKAMFEEELRIKNQQIAGLQRTVDVLVGKSEGAIEEPTLTEYMTYEEKLSLYVSTVATQMGADLSHLKALTPTSSKHVAEQKLVAPRSRKQRISALE